jgi:hypothetical protein
MEKYTIEWAKEVVDHMVSMSLKIIELETHNADLIKENKALQVDVKGLNIQIGELKSELTTVRCQNR